MSERKFSKALGKPGMAAQVRETVSQVVKDSVQVTQIKLVEPIDYENFVLKNKTLLQNDPQRELLLYPSDDVSQVVLPRKYRTIAQALPSSSEISNCNLFVKECLKSYSSNWNLVHYKYSAYSGTYLDLPKVFKSEELKEEVYEIDTDVDQVDEESFTRVGGITKEGYLLKGPDVGGDRIFVNLGSKSYKRRYCYLRHHVDGTYYLELHKDEKKGEPKATIDMDFCTEVVKNAKKGRYCFELQMSGHKTFSFVAENEIDMQDWIVKLDLVIQQNRAQEEKRCASLERSCTTPPPSPQPSQVYGTLKGLDESMNPQLIKYGRETDASIALSRKENRKRLFSIYPYMPHIKVGASNTSEPNCEPYREHFGLRILIRCESIKFKLQALEEDQDSPGQVEPYFTSLALFDVRQNRKLTENFYFDVNHSKARAMIPADEGGSANVKKSLATEISKLPDEWIIYPKQALFSVSNPHPDIYLVLRIDKVLQGAINTACEPYVKSARDPRLGSKVQKTAKAVCQRLGKYRMPFAWTARPLFRTYSNDLDTSSDFPAIYRQEPNRLKDEEILKLLSEYRKGDKLSKLTVVPGWAKIKISELTETPENSLTSSLVPLKPFPLPPTNDPTFEVTEFEGTSENDAHPYTVFSNHLYIYPLSLNFDTQKNFTRARNIACCIELRDSDTENAEPLYCLYGRPGSPLLGQRIITSVLHHNTSPIWYEEIKLRLPIHLKPEHHLLFTFYHVSCELNKKKENGVESCVGYAWLPLLHKGRLCVEEQSLAVASHLPVGYLSIQPLGLGRGNAGPDITWIDGQRQIFTVGFQLVSTVITRDLHLHNLFCHIEKLVDKQSAVIPSESETCKILKASHAIHLTTAITFLPTILNQLFNLLLIASTKDIGLNVIRVLIHIIHMIQEAGKKDILQPYVKFVFVTPTLPSLKTTVHEELSKHLPTLLSPSNTDFLVVNKFMNHSSFFFQIMIKSMVQYLLNTGRIKMLRHERFTPEYLDKIEELLKILIPYVITKHKEMPLETLELNKSIALFLKKCLTIMDRGYIFRLINYYMEYFKGSDSRTLHEYKFTFLQIICSHEHYVAFNLPVLHLKLRPSRNGDSPVSDFNLTEEFRKHHYLVGLLLQETTYSLNQVSQIRKHAISTLRDLLAKHELDDRYQSKGQLTRIASLYLPWLSIVLDNLNRLRVVQNDSVHNILDTRHSRMSSNSSLMQCGSTANSVKPFQRFALDQNSRASVYLKDSHLFAVIAGQSGMINGTSSMSLGSDESADGLSTASQETTIIRDSKDDFDLKTHSRSFSGVTTASQQIRCDKFQISEIRDILLCFLFVIKYLGEESLISWWQQSHYNTVLYFFSAIEICLHQFKYIGKKQIVGKPAQAKPVKAMTLPARMQPPDFSKSDGSNLPIPSGTSSIGRDGQLAIDSDSSKVYQALLEANMATEVGLIALDTLGLYCVHFKENLIYSQGDNAIMRKIFDIYLFFLQVGQSETLFRHVFAALRAFINNFSDALFEGNAELCGRLCYELLKCCNSKLSTIRQESCVILYLLMRSNFEFTKRKGLTRVHLQVIISVSQMLGNIVGLNNARFQESLSLINNYAKSDKVMKDTGLKFEVKDLTKRIRTVLMATAQMREHHQDPELLVDLQHSLANSYASTPELRLTWLQTMTRNHHHNGNFSEATCCQLHIAAMIAEYLKLKKVQSWGAEAFEELSSNISKDETGLKLDSGIQDVQFTEQILLEQLENCVPLVEKAERYELLGPLFKLIIPIYEKRRNYQALAQCHQNLAESYAKISEVNKSGKRLLGRYYRIAFYGQICFDDSNEEHNPSQKNGIEYIYKEPKVTSLSEVSEKLYKLYGEKYGRETVKIVMDSKQVNPETLDPKLVYIQVTSVTPYFTKKELEVRQTEFETTHDINCFMFETPFTKDGRVRGSPEEQWKRRTILKTKHSFPYVKKRIEVVDRTIEERSPIEVALDEMKQKVNELEDVVFTRPTDAKKLQLRLQGSICVQVNAGPLAYANAFLDRNGNSNYTDTKVEELKDIFQDFVRICYCALQVNSKVIEADQQEYQDVLQTNFQKMCQSLSSIFGESICPEGEQGEFKRHSQTVFSVISGSSHSSSIA
ncbi:hypothetical protein RUM43_009529 [Polyplax serrata]|uniref:Dedicator of cytokinesis protein 9 n=1 Tax=Polyplax serrata TaxID=468196 RepID=A0AAN8PD72_POLSC